MSLNKAFLHGMETAGDWQTLHRIKTLILYNLLSYPRKISQNASAMWLGSNMSSSGYRQWGAMHIDTHFPMRQTCLRFVCDLTAEQSAEHFPSPYSGTTTATQLLNQPAKGFNLTERQRRLLMSNFIKGE